MQTPVDFQSGDLYREAVMEVRTETKTGVPSSLPSYYEHLHTAKHAEVTFGAEQAPPLCEKYL